MCHRGETNLSRTMSNVSCSVRSTNTKDVLRMIRAALKSEPTSRKQLVLVQVAGLQKLHAAPFILTNVWE